MYFKLKKSIFEPALFEIWEDDALVSEISIPFLIKKIPSSFESIEAVQKWVKGLEVKLARQSAYGSLAKRNHSSKGLLRKLVQKGFSESVCLELIDELKRLDLIKDDTFIQSMIEKELRGGHGPRYIEAKLRSQGLSVDQVRKIVTKDMQLEAIFKLLKKLSKNQAAALQRRGFDFDAINQALRSYTS